MFSIAVDVACPRCRAPLADALKTTPAEFARRLQTGAGGLPRCLKCGHSGRGLIDFLIIHPTTLQVRETEPPRAAEPPARRRRV